MDGYFLTDAQRNGLINYLSRYPYAEVHDAIEQLSQLPAVTAQPPGSPGRADITTPTT